MQILVSVIIPCYNREKTVKRCIESIMKQTVNPIEIIVVDDGSSDHTIDILETLQLKCNYLKIVKQNHRGAQAARNLGILNATGTYVAFLDSDDEWMPHMLEVCLTYINSGDENNVLYSDGYKVKGGKRSIFKLPCVDGDVHSFLLQYPGPTFSSMMVKKDKLLQVGLLDENVLAYQEWDTAIKLSKVCKFIHIKKPLFLYYLHQGETISKDWKKGVRGYYYIIKKNKQEIIQNIGVRALFRHYGILLFKIFKRIS